MPTTRLTTPHFTPYIPMGAHIGASYLRNMGAGRENQLETSNDSCAALCAALRWVLERVHSLVQRL